MSTRQAINDLRTRRENCEATLDDVARLSGLDRSTIYRHEAGRIAKITRVSLRAWMRALDELEAERRTA